MKRVIFTVFDQIQIDMSSVEIDDKDLFERITNFNHNADTSKQLLVKEYYDRLIQNKKDYAQKIGVDFIFYENTMKDFNVDAEMEFTKVNLYKHCCMAKLAQEYDEILYVDMDVLFNTEENIFEEHDCSKGIHVFCQDPEEYQKDKNTLIMEELGYRSPILKYHITKDLLDGKDNHVMNTGIMLANSETILQIKYVERMKEAIIRVQEIKSNITHMFQTLYYPNNESIFSYILEKYNIPHVKLEEEWHTIYNDTPKAGCEGKCIHMISKQFAKFFKDKTKVIYSLYIDIDAENLDNPKSYKDNEENKSAIAKRMFKDYETQIIQNHQEYANAIGAEYKLYGRDDEYEEFLQRFPDLSEYDVINLYKIWKLDQLTKEYDFVCYVDFDVLFNQHIDMFEHVPANYSFVCAFSQIYDMIPEDNYTYFKKYNKDFRNPQAKYWNTHALLQEEDFSGYNCVFNTGVIIASRYVMDKIDYFSDIDEVIQKMKELKEDEFSMYPDNVRASFGYDNETIMGYKVQKNKVNHIRPSAWFHLQHMYKSKDAFTPGTPAFDINAAHYKKLIKDLNVVCTHFISKNFAVFFDA